MVDDDPARQVLDEFYRLPDSLDEGADALLERFTGQGLQVMINDDGELRPATTAELGLAQSTVSKHLACLRDCQLVDFRAEGRQSFYYLTRPELLDLLRSGEALLAATGSAVALCPVYGTTIERRS